MSISKIIDEIKSKLDIREKPLVYADEVISDKKQRLEANKKAIELIKQGKESYSDEEKRILARYTGFGSIGDDNDEYYTPKEVAKESWKFLNAQSGDTILDPSTGTGIFSSQAPSGIEIKGCDLNPVSGKIADILNDNSNIQAGVSFEEYSKNLANESLDGVITNVPFGNREDKYKKMDAQHILKNEDYFILKSLDILKSGKRAVFLTSSSTIQRKGKDRKGTRTEILSKASFVGGYRLPSEMFADTGTEQVVDILVFEKHPKQITEAIKNDAIDWNSFQEALGVTNKEFLDGAYFDNNPKQVIGKFTSREELIKRAEGKGEKLHHLAQRDTVSLPDGMTIEEVKKRLPTLTNADFKNLLDYKSIIIAGTEKAILSNSVSISSDEDFKKLSNELELLREGKTNNLLKDEEFIKLYENIEKTKFGHFNNELLYARYVSAKTKYSRIFNYLLFTHEYKAKKIIENKEQIKALLDVKKLKISGEYQKYIVDIIRKVSKLDLDKGVMADDLVLESYSPYKLFSDKKIGEGGYNESDFSKEELKDETVVFISDGKVLPLDTFIDTLKGKSYYGALGYVNNLNISSNVLNDSELNKKKEALLQTLEGYKSSINISTLRYSLSFIKRINKEELFTPIKKRLENLTSLKKTILARMNEELKTSDIKANAKDVLKYNWYSWYLSHLAGDSNKGYFKGGVEAEAEKPIILQVLSKMTAHINNIIKLEIEKNSSYQEAIKLYLDEHSTVEYLSAIETDESKCSELSGFIKQDAIETARHYQNSDSRKFATNQSGVIACDTGLGKARLIIMTALQMIKRGTAKRPLIVIPKAVFGSFVDGELKTLLTDDMLEKTLIIDTDNVSDIRKAQSSNKYRLIVMAMPTLATQFKLSEETTDYLYGADTKEENNASDTKYATHQLRDSVGKYARWDKKAKFFFEDTKIDAMIIDEAHFLKNAVASGKNTKGLNSATSDMGIRFAYFAEYIRQVERNDYKGVVLSTATPETSSPTEIYTSLLLSGQYEKMKRFGIKDMKDFEEMFFEIEDISVEKANGTGLTIKSVLTGLKNVSLLKQVGHNSIIYRNAETEQAKALENGQVINVKPESNEYTSVVGSNSEIADVKSALSEANDELIKEALALKKGRIKEKELGKDRYRVIKEFGEIFGYISRVRQLAVNKDLALGYTPIKVNANKQDVYEVVKDITILGKDYELKSNKFGDFYEAKDIKTTVGEFFKSSYYNYLFDNYTSLTMPFFKDGIFYAPTKEVADIKRILTALKKAKMIDPKDVFDVEMFPKYKELISNIKDEIKRHPSSKQIIYTTLLATFPILEELLKKSIKGIGNIYSFNGTTIKNSEKAVEVQEKFNSDSELSFLIFNKKGQVGVNFNKNVCAVHLLDVADTPDDHHQAKGRAVRQGNDIDYVNVYKYYQQDTFDSFLDDLTQGKQDWINNLKQGKDSSIDTTDRETIIQNAERMFINYPDMPIEEKISKYVEKIRTEQKEKDEELKDILATDLLKGLNEVDEAYEKAKSAIPYSERDTTEVTAEHIEKAYKKKISDKYIWNNTMNIENIGTLRSIFNYIKTGLAKDILQIKERKYTTYDKEGIKEKLKRFFEELKSNKTYAQSFTKLVGEYDNVDTAVNNYYDEVEAKVNKEAEQDYNDFKNKVINRDEIKKKIITEFASQISEKKLNGLSREFVINNFEDVKEIDNKLYNTKDENYIFVKRGYYRYAYYKMFKIKEDGTVHREDTINANEAILIKEMSDDDKEYFNITSDVLANIDILAKG